eukprot:5572219-Ditylum_brightwellii.AAC.1
MDVTTFARIQGQEYIGLSILTIAALPGMLRNACLEKKFADLNKIRTHELTTGLTFKKFGSPENFNSQYLESYLKTFVKHPAKRNRTTHADLLHDLFNRWSEHANINQYVANLPGISTVAREEDNRSGHVNKETSSK